MSGIFFNTAPLYWAAGMSAIPLQQSQKRPIPEGWQAYAETPVPIDTQNFWLSQHPNGNVGLVLGPQSNLCMIDVDTDDLNLQAIISKFLPPSPWERRGKKGCALAYRFSGFKTFRIKDATGKMIVECLSTGTQLVLPPSIHPETKKPYQADTDLYDPAVQASLLHLPVDIEAILRSAIEAAGVKLSLSGHTRVTDYVASGARDVKMIAVAGLLASGVLRAEMPFMVAVDRLRAWKSSCVETIAGDDIDIEKGVARLAEFLIRDVMGPKKMALPDGWDLGLNATDRTGFGFDQFSELNVAWTFDKLKDYLWAEFMIHDPQSQGRRNAVNYILDRMVFSKLEPKDETALLRWMARTSETDYTEVSLRKTLQKLRQSGIEGDNQTQIAQAMIEELNSGGGDHEVSFTSGEFWQWHGSHWVKLPKADLLRDIAVQFGHLPAAKRAGDHRGIWDIMSTLVNQQELKQTAEVGVNFANGFLTPNMELRPHDPMYGCTYTLPYRYTPEVGCPKFLQFLDDCWDEDNDRQQKLDAVQEAIAVTIFGVAPQMESVFLLHGPPKSGKSQLLNIVESLLPHEVCCSVGPESWGDKFLPAQMFGKLLNSAGELSENRKIDGKNFKTITSGESMTGQHKNGQPFQFRVYAAHWFASNHIPRTDDTSGGFTRRWLVITYNKIVDDQHKVLNLGQQIAIAEREAIVSWAVKAIGRTMETKVFTKPSSHYERMEEVAKANNSLRSFLLDSGKVLIGSFAGNSPTPTPENDLYNAYFTFALAAGDARPASMIIFRQRMRELGSELGFRVVISKNSHGGQDCVYEKCIIAKGNVVTLRNSVSTG